MLVQHPPSTALISRQLQSLCNSHHLRSPPFPSICTFPHAYPPPSPPPPPLSPLLHPLPDGWFLRG